MKNKYFWLSFLILVFGISGFGQNGKIQIFETGGFHHEEVLVKNGETWLGLYSEGETFSLLPSVIAVEEVNDPIATETRVEVLGRERPILLIRGTGFVEARAVPTVFGGADEIDNDFDRTFEFSGQTYGLRVENDKSEIENPNRLNSTSKLVLRRGKTTQTIYQVKRCVFCHWQINWAGDLDGDGKLDFYFYLTDHYNVANMKLFLSSYAEGGKLVKDVAKFRTTGC